MGLFNRSAAPVGLKLAGQSAVHVYHGDVLVWDGTRSAFVPAVRMLASAAARVPGVSAVSDIGTIPALSATVAAISPALIATATPAAPLVSAVSVVAPAPTVVADALVAVDAMTGAVQVLPGIGAENNDWTVGAPAGVVSATVAAPAVDASINRQPPAIAVSAVMPAPVVTSTGSGTVAPPAIAVSAVVPAPVVSAGSARPVPAATGSASLSAPVVGAHVTVAAVPATVSASAPTPVVEAVHFTPSGMTKTGTQSFTTSYAQAINWAANTGTHPGSTVVSNALQVQGGKPDATIAVSLPYSSSFGYNRRAQIKVNGTVVATSAAFTATSGTITVTATNVAVADGDDITVWIIMETYASGSISAGGTVTVT